MLLISKPEGRAILGDPSRRGKCVGEGGNLSITVIPKQPRFFLFLCTVIITIRNHFSGQRGQKYSRCRCVEAIRQSMRNHHVKQKLRGIGAAVV